MVKRAGLGRGLSALMGDDAPREGASGRRAQSAPVEHLSPSPYQPRVHFEADRISELVESVKEKGIIQPILVRPIDGGKYEIVAGERRWRAAQQAGLHDVPIVVRDLKDGEALEIAIIENVQREDLSPVEEARGYQRLMDDFGHTQDQVGRLVAKSRSHVANLLRLLSLPAEVLAMIESGQLSMGHARSLIGTDDPLALAKEILVKGLNVRQAETLGGAAKGNKSRKATSSKDADTLALEKRLAAALGLSVNIDFSADTEKGSIKLAYNTLEQLDELCEKLLGEKV